MPSRPHAKLALPLAALCAATLLLAPAVGSRTAEAGDSAKRRQVRKLLKLTGADKIGAQVMHQLLANLKRGFHNVPPSYWRKLKSRLDTKELVEKIIPVYERHFTSKDIRGLIAFYQTPLGKKFIRTQPKLVAESMQIGQAWGQSVAQRVVREIQQMKKK